MILIFCYRPTQWTLLVNFIALAVNININININNIYHSSNINNNIDNNNNNVTTTTTTTTTTTINNNNNNNACDMHYDAVIATIYPLHLTNVEQSWAAAHTKITNFGRVHLQAGIIYTHHCHLALLLSADADAHDMSIWLRLNSEYLI